MKSMNYGFKCNGRWSAELRVIQSRFICSLFRSFSIEIVKKLIDTNLITASLAGLSACIERLCIIHAPLATFILKEGEWKPLARYQVLNCRTRLDFNQLEVEERLVPHYHNNDEAVAFWNPNGDKATVYLQMNNFLDRKWVIPVPKGTILSFESNISHLIQATEDTILFRWGYCRESVQPYYWGHSAGEPLRLQMLGK